MGSHALDRQLNQYWSQLTAAQKQSLLLFVQSFYEEEKSSSPENPNELQDPEATYNIPWQIFKPLSKQQKKALIAFLESSGIEPAQPSIAYRKFIDEYNKDIDEAEAEYERGEFYTQEQVEEISKSWVNGAK